MHLEAGFDWSVMCRLLVTKLPIRDVHSSVAIGGKADSARTAQFGRVWPECMVRPCVARRFGELAVRVLHQCIRPLVGGGAPGHHGYQRAGNLISGSASTGHLGHQFLPAPGRPNLHLFSSSRRPRQVS